MTKRHNEAVGTALAGAGAVGTGAGLVAGGVPGTKADFQTVMNPAIKRSQGGGKHKGANGPGTGADGAHKGDSRLKARSKLPKAGRAGIFGFRIDAHEGGTEHFKNLDAAHEAAGTKTAKDAFYRGHNQGKIPAELKILRSMSRGRHASNALLAGGLATTAYGIHRTKVSKKDTDKYHGALLGTGATAAVGSHYGSKYLDTHRRRNEAKASSNVDEAGKLVPSLAGRKKKKISDKQAGKLIRANKPHPLTPEPVVSDGDIGRNPKLLEGVDHKTAEKVGHLRGTAAQERHFAHVFGNTAKVVRMGRAPSAAVAAAGAGGLVVAHHKIKKRQRIMSDAEIKRRKKLQATTSKTTSTLGLAGVATGVAAIAASKKPGSLKYIRKIPGHKNITAPQLKDRGLYTSLASGGIGGIGGYNFAAYTNAESRKRTPAVVPPKKKIQKSADMSAFGVVHNPYTALTAHRD